MTRTVDALHKNLPLGQNHILHDGEYADATARLAETAFTDDNVDKIYKQLDDNSLWRCISQTSGVPTWKRLDGAGGTLGFNDITEVTYDSGANAFIIPCVEARYYIHNTINNPEIKFSAPNNGSTWKSTLIVIPDTAHTYATTIIDELTNHGIPFTSGYSPPTNGTRFLIEFERYGDAGNPYSPHAFSVRAYAADYY